MATAAAVLAGSPLSLAAVIDEIVVTAQKREQSIQDVGIAMQAFTGEQLDELGLQTSLDVARLTPGVFLSGNTAGQNAQFTIRGVVQSDFADIAESPIAVYVDEGYISLQNGQLFGLFDLERVEVLKGPQGTLFGRNATGGLVQYVTRKPTEQFDSYVDLTYGDYDQTRVEAAVSGPLANGWGGRVALLYSKHDEIMNNVIDESLTDALRPGEDLWNDDTKALRGHLTFSQSEDFAVRLTGAWAKQELSEAPYQNVPVIRIFDDQGRTVDTVFAAPDETREGIGPGGANYDANGDGTIITRPVPGADWFGYIDPDGEDFDIGKDQAYSGGNPFDSDGNNFETFGGQLRFDVGFGALEFVSLTDFKDFEKRIFVDVDAGSGNGLLVDFSADQQMISQEFRLSSPTEQRLRWVAGVYYLDIDAEIPRQDFIGFPDGPFGALRISNYDIDLETRSYSLFGQVEYDLTDTLTLIAGLRPTREEKDYVYNQGLWNFEGTVETVQLRTFADDRSDTLWSGKVQLEWSPTDDLLVYGGINQGVKAGSYNSPLFGDNTPDEEIPYKEEELTSYEMGFKSTFADGRLTLNSSLYYYDYKDFQAFKFTGLSGPVFNADATTKGVEVLVSAQPIDGLELVLSGNYLDAEVEDVQLFGFVRDVQPPFTPDVTLSGLVRYEFPVGPGSVALQADANYSDEFYYQITNYQVTQFDSYTLTNLRATYFGPDKRWQIGAFLENVSDERNNTVGFDLATICGCAEEAYGKPRWWGVNARINFGGT
jgi:iron complex outermembrane receptor protein